MNLGTWRAPALLLSVANTTGLLSPDCAFARVSTGEMPFTLPRQGVTDIDFFGPQPYT